MTQDFWSNVSAQKTVALVSEYNGLAISLLEKLLAHFFCVTVFCAKKDLWFQESPYLKGNRHLFFVDLQGQDEEFDFLIFISSFFDNLAGEKERVVLRNEETRIKKLLSFIKVRDKRIFVLPYFVFDGLGRGLSNIYNRYVKQDSVLNNLIVFLGNVLGPRVVLNNRDESLMVLKGLIKKRQVEVPVLPSCEIRPSRVVDVCRKIVEMLSSKDLVFFRVLVSGEPIVLGSWINGIERSFRFFKCSFTKDGGAKTSGIFEKELIMKNVVDLNFLKRTIDWFEANPDAFYLDETPSEIVEEPEETEKVEEPIPVRQRVDFALPLDLVRRSLKQKSALFRSKLSFGAINNGGVAKIKGRILARRKLINKKEKASPAKRLNALFLYRYLVFSLSAVLTFLLIPIVSFLLSVFSLWLGIKWVKNGSFPYGRHAFSFSKEAASLSLSQFYFYSDMPVIGIINNLFVVPAKFADVSLRVSEIALLAVDGVWKTLSLSEKALNGQESSLSSYSQELVLTSDYIYKKISFLDAQLKSIIQSWPFTYLAKYVEKVDLRRRREEVQTAKTVFSLIGEILGEDGERVYLVLLQNNMEIRPTGGFVGSFAIVGFNRGAMTKFEIYDVYSADGQLKGHVEPPWQLKEYLNQPAWYLRDSNWNPDFPLSAQRAEWFLDKSMGIQVDGVIAVDLNFALDLVGVFGSIYVPEFDKTIDQKNFYEVVQYEAERDFFPGSRQKQNFLLSLSRSLLNRVKSADKKEFVGVFEKFYQNLNKRHVQIFLHQARLQEEIEGLGWSGSVKQPHCIFDNCLYDWASLIEANLGVNKANYFISRELALTTSVFQDVVKHDLEVNFFNKAEFFMGDKGRYKFYLRLLLPLDVEIKKVSLKKRNNLVPVDFKEELVSGLKEVGFFLEIEPKENATVYFEWERKGVDLGKNGEYRFYLRKQAGIDFLPFSFKIGFPPDFVVGSDNLPRLTKEGSFIYNNQSLDKDFVARFYW